MKYAEYNIGNNTIEVFNSHSGKEEIFLNQEKISQKRSIFGAKHSFTIDEDQYVIKPCLDLFSHSCVSFKILKNGLPVQIENSHKIETDSQIWVCLFGLFGIVMSLSLLF